MNLHDIVPFNPIVPDTAITRSQLIDWWRYVYPNLTLTFQADGTYSWTDPFTGITSPVDKISRYGDAEEVLRWIRNGRTYR